MAFPGLLMAASAGLAQIGPILDLPPLPGERGLGQSVGVLGDVTGDDVGDLIIGAHRSDPFSTGLVRLVDGATGATIRTIHGAAQGEWYGHAVAGIGDANGDGVPDFAVGAPSASPTLVGQGRVEVRSGAGIQPVLFEIVGTGAGDRLGHAVAAAGDVDGDGRADVIVGVPSDDDNGLESGSAFVFGGDGSQLFQRTGWAPHDRLGWAVGGGGDVDADGRADFMAGTLGGGGTPTGYALVFSGDGGGLIHSFAGTGCCDRFGAAVAMGGDADGDGFDDVLIGAYDDLTNGPASGATHLFSGQTGDLLYKRVGVESSDSFGWSVAWVGDVDGDGAEDFIAGARAGGGAGLQDGYARVFSGLDGVLKLHLAGPTASNFGYSVAGGHDTNGNGLADVIVGAPFEEAPKGHARVFSGTCGLIIEYGPACDGVLGTPVLAVGGCATPLGTLTIAVEDGFPLRPAWLLIGVMPAELPLLGCTLLVSPLLVEIPQTLDINGGFGFSASVPAGLQGVTVVMQAWMEDHGGPHGFAATNGVLVALQ